MEAAGVALRNPADQAPRLSVTHTNRVSYINGRPCTLRAIEKGRYAVFTYDNALHNWHPICAFETEAEAQHAQYDLINSSDDLMQVETCHCCFAILTLIDAPPRHDGHLFCSKRCAEAARREVHIGWQRISVAAAILFFAWGTSLGWLNSVLIALGMAAR